MNPILRVMIGRTTWPAVKYLAGLHQLIGEIYALYRERNSTS